MFTGVEFVVIGGGFVVRGGGFMVRRGGFMVTWQTEICGNILCSMYENMVSKFFDPVSNPPKWYISAPQVTPLGRIYTWLVYVLSCTYISKCCSQDHRFRLLL
jgi:hypothetical protein